MVQTGSSSGRQIGFLYIFAVTFGAGVFFAVFVAIAILRNPAEVTSFLRDPAVVYKFSPFAGLVSYIGIFATFSTGAICLFAASNARDGAPLLGAVGGFSLLIAADDLLMLHEEVFPEWVGIQEHLVLFVYLLIAAGIAVRFRATLFGEPTAGLGFAVALLGASVVLDALTEYSRAEVIIEDGLKFLGLMAWAVYWINRSNLAVRAALRPAG